MQGERRAGKEASGIFSPIPSRCLSSTKVGNTFGKAKNPRKNTFGKVFFRLIRHLVPPHTLPDTARTLPLFRSPVLEKRQKDPKKPWKSGRKRGILPWKNGKHRKMLSSLSNYTIYANLYVTGFFRSCMAVTEPLFPRRAVRAAFARACAHPVVLAFSLSLSHFAWKRLVISTSGVTDVLFRLSPSVTHVAAWPAAGSSRRVVPAKANPCVTVRCDRWEGGICHTFSH